MPYFECEECGGMADLSVFEHSQVRQDCPVCEETTTWSIAFDSGEGEGVSF